MTDIFQRLFDVLEDRKGKDAASSYVASLYAGGIPKMNSKITEEAAEVCEAAFEDETDHLVKEICDLLFHTFVLAAHRDVRPEDIAAELERRYGTSGHTEKASRSKQ